MIESVSRLSELAAEHGVEIEAITPPNQAERLRMLRSVLQRTDVPFPIEANAASAYYKLAESGVAFEIGSLSGETVDLESYQNRQHYDELTYEDHVSWACLVADQQATKRQYACREYMEGEAMFEIGGNVIPDYYVLNARIYQQTGWQLATVSEIIPAEVFFHCHSRKFFPVTTFMRPVGADYLEEPDIGHDIAGHVATFTIPQVALVMNNHGLANNAIHREKEAKLKDATRPEEIDEIQAEAMELLLYAGRLYWFTVEFGLVMQSGSLKSFGAGILSSPGETRYSLDSPDPNRILVDVADDRDLLRLATTDYLISEFQKTYFVMKDFESLATLTPKRILDTVRLAKQLPHHTWRELVPGDDVFNVGRSVTSPNEKYYRLLAKQPLDDCLRRTAIRNLKIANNERKPNSHREERFIDEIPLIPQEILEAFNEQNINGEFNEYS